MQHPTVAEPMIHLNPLFWGPVKPLLATELAAEDAPIVLTGILLSLVVIYITSKRLLDWDCHYRQGGDGVGGFRSIGHQPTGDRLWHDSSGRGGTRLCRDRYRQRGSG
jgi:hypothetical protein